MSPSDIQEYFIYQNAEQLGPYTFLQLRTMWAAGQLSADTLFFHEGMSDWAPLRSIEADLMPESTVKPKGYFAQFKEDMAKQKLEETKNKKPSYGCLAIVLVLVVATIIGSQLPDPEYTKTTQPEDPKVKATWDKIYKEAPYATYEQGYRSARKAGLTSNEERMISIIKSWGSSAAFIQGYRDGIKDNIEAEN